MASGGREASLNLDPRPRAEPESNPAESRSVDTQPGAIAAPAHFIDFETIAPALPIYPGTRPFEVRPVQWSDHVLHADGSVTHAEFLAAGDKDPVREFAESLVEQLAGAATLVIYSGYEAVRLHELARALPELRRSLDRVLATPRVDLLHVIRSTYYDPEFRGSSSLKSVLPVLVPELGYDHLAVHDGTQASLAFLEMASEGCHLGGASSCGQPYSRTAGATRRRRYGSSRLCVRPSNPADLPWRKRVSSAMERM